MNLNEKEYIAKIILDIYIRNMIFLLCYEK